MEIPHFLKKHIEVANIIKEHYPVTESEALRLSIEIERNEILKEISTNTYER